MALCDKNKGLSYPEEFMSQKSILVVDDDDDVDDVVVGGW